MIGQRLEIRGLLKVLTPLHIGDGARREITGVDGKTRGIRTVERDADGAPYLPGSSLKGVLRDAFSGLGDVARFFGPGEIAGGDAAISGRIIFRNAWFHAGPSNETSGRAAARAGDAPHAALMVETHVAKDAASGVAARAKLFQDDIVLPGTTFALSLALFDLDTAGRAGLDSLLSLLAQERGLPFGRAGRQGMGRVRLLPDSVKATLEPGSRVDRLKPVQPLKPSVPNVRLRLLSPVPFLIHDPHRPQPAASGETAQRNNTLLSLQPFAGSGARLTGSTLLGALRARFDDFARRKRKGDATERMFGKTDQRGRVAILDLKTTATGQGKTIMSVKLDRFSGAPIDNALFGTEAWFGSVFDLDLGIESRGNISAETQADDAKLFADFVEELSDCVWGGLMLGHGVSRGYGWFKVEKRT